MKNPPDKARGCDIREEEGVGQKDMTLPRIATKAKIGNILPKLRMRDRGSTNVRTLYVFAEK